MGQCGLSLTPGVCVCACVCVYLVVYEVVQWPDVDSFKHQACVQVWTQSHGQLLQQVRMEKTTATQGNVHYCN